MDANEVRQLAIEVLKAHGWTEFAGGPALATRLYETAVGEKQAVVHLSVGDEYNRTLQGKYESEGRNALESSGVLLPKGASADEVRRLTGQFAERADKAVAQTYAAGLLLRSRERERG